MGKLTNWECGQELIKVVDSLDEAISKIKDGYPKIANALKRHADSIGLLFNKQKSHVFNLKEDRQEIVKIINNLLKHSRECANDYEHYPNYEECVRTAKIWLND